MAHYAELDANNIVLGVIVTDNALESSGQTVEKQEALGLAWLATFPPTAGKTYVKTSYNGTIRKNYAEIGGTYRRDIDAFVGKQPFPSWSLNKVTARWEAPVAKPKDGGDYYWDEDVLQWVKL